MLACGFRVSCVFQGFGHVEVGLYGMRALRIFFHKVPERGDGVSVVFGEEHAFRRIEIHVFLFLLGFCAGQAHGVEVGEVVVEPSRLLVYAFDSGKGVVGFLGFRIILYHFLVVFKRLVPVFHVEIREAYFEFRFGIIGTVVVFEQSFECLYGLVVLSCPQVCAPELVNGLRVEEASLVVLSYVLKHFYFLSVVGYEAERQGSLVHRIYFV